MKLTNNHTALIKKLGGYIAVQEKLKLGNTTVFKWEKRGEIPTKYWERIAKLLVENNIRFTSGDFFRVKR